jgi:hypothetical protein
MRLPFGGDEYMDVSKWALGAGILMAMLLAGGWQASRQRGWEYAVVEVGSVSEMRSNVFFLDQYGYHDMDMRAAEESGSKHENVSTNTDLRLRMVGKVLAKLGNEGWELVGTGPAVADTPNITYYLKRPK